jgi:hypothetical protein
MKITKNNILKTINKFKFQKKTGWQSVHISKEALFDNEFKLIDGQMASPRDHTVNSFIYNTKYDERKSDIIEYIYYNIINRKEYLLKYYNLEIIE